MLANAGLTVDDARWVSQGLAGRLPGLVAGQLDGVSLHPEDVYLAQEELPDVNLMSVLADEMPNYVFNMYGASDDYIARDRAAPGRRHGRHDRGQPGHVPGEGQGHPDHHEGDREAAGRGGIRLGRADQELRLGGQCRLRPARAEWTIDNNVALGDIPPETKPSYEQLVDELRSPTTP